MLPISNLNGNATPKKKKKKLDLLDLECTHTLYLHSGQRKFHPKIKLVHTNFYHTNIWKLEIIEISLTKITKQHSMKDGSNTKCKIKFRVQRKQNK